MTLYNESRVLDVTNLQGDSLTRCLRLRLRDIVAEIRAQHNLPHDKPLALKIGGATTDRWRRRSSDLTQYPRNLFHAEKFLVLKGGVSDVEGAELEATCISLMRTDVSGALCINTRLEVPPHEHRNASAARPSAVYINVVLPELKIETYVEWMVAWHQHQLTTPNPPLRREGLDAYHTGQDAVSLGTAKPQPSGAARKQHVVPTARVFGLDFDALRLAWDEGGLAMPYSLPQMFSGGRTRFNSYLGDIRESSSELKKLIDSKVCGGQLATNKFKELHDAFNAAQAEAGTDAADDTQPPPRKKAMLAPPPRKQEDKEEGEEEEAGVYMLSTSQLPRPLRVFAPIRADATWDEIVAKYSKCFDEHISTAVWESGGVRTLVFDNASLAAAKAAFVAAADDSTSMMLRSWSDAESRAAEVDVD